MRKLGWTSILFLVLAVICRLTYEMIGVEVDEKGVLHEPFALIPLGSLSLLISIVAGGAYFMMRFWRRK